MITRRKRENPSQDTGLIHAFDQEASEFFRDKQFKRQVAIWFPIKLHKAERQIAELTTSSKSTVHNDLERWKEYKIIEDMKFDYVKQTEGFLWNEKRPKELKII